jgi:chloramphenicol-sensitive protein RarD
LDRAAVVAGLVSYSLWGVLPLFLHQVARTGAGAFEVVAWRTIWSVPLALGLGLWMGKRAGVGAALTSPRLMATLALSAALIGVNWTVYVWAVGAGHTLSASLGYYLNPLLSMAVGALFFRERISRTGAIAIGLASIGVVIQGLALGEFPWVSLVLAISFCGYGVVRKQAPVDAGTGLFVECVALAIPALAYVIWLSSAGHGAFGKTPAATVWLMLCGPATVAPLALFAVAARRLPLTVIGFMQFIAPTLQFLCGLIAGESLTPLRALSFVFIWAGVLVFAAGAVWNSRNPRPSRLPRIRSGVAPQDEDFNIPPFSS